MAGIQTLIDSTTTPGITYICKTALGVATSYPVWEIVAVDSTGSTKFPKDTNWVVSDEPIFKADDRATLVYSYN